MENRESNYSKEILIARLNEYYRVLKAYERETDLMSIKDYLVAIRTVKFLSPAIQVLGNHLILNAFYNEYSLKSKYNRARKSLLRVEFLLDVKRQTFEN